MMAERVRWRTWPVELTEGDVLLRPLRRRDAADWRALRLANHAWLAPWEATHPDVRVARPDLRRDGPAVQPGGAGRADAAVRGRARRPAGRPAHGRAGSPGARCVRRTSATGWTGRVAGRGITPTAVAMAVDYCFFALGLHRLEVNIRPENAASLRVVEKLGFRQEGVRQALPAHRRRVARPRDVRAHRGRRPGRACWRAGGSRRGPPRSATQRVHRRHTRHGRNACDTPAIGA